MFLDLEDMAQNSEIVDLESCNQVVMDVGVTSQGRFLLPLTYTFSALLFDRSALNDPDYTFSTLEELLQSGSIDLALAALESTSTNLAYELIEKENVGILAGRDSATAKRFRSGKAISLTDTEGDSYVCLTKGHSSRVVQDKLFRRYGFAPHVLLETDSLEVGRRVAVEAGACMVLSDIYVDDYVHQHRGEFFKLKDYENYRHFYACYRKDEFIPMYIRDFIRITTRVLSQHRKFPD